MARETSDVVAVILEPGFKDWYIEETLRHFREDPVANKSQSISCVAPR